MKKYSLLVSLIALLGCEPREFDLYGNDYDQQPVYEEQKSYEEQVKDEVVITEEIIVIQEARVNDQKKQGYDKAEKTQKLKSHNKVKKPVAKKAKAKKKAANKTQCNCEKCGCNKAKVKKHSKKPIVKITEKKKAKKAVKKSAPKDVEQKTIVKEVTIEPVLSDEEKEQNDAITKIRKQESQKFEKIWATKPIVMEVNGSTETTDDQVMGALGYMSSQSKPVCISDPNLAFAKNAYQRVLETSEGCCRNYISKSLQKTYGKDATYKFLTDDYNFYKAGELCMFYSDQDIANIFGTAKTWDIIKEARNQCGCLNKSALQRDIRTLRIILDHKNMDRRSLVYKIKDEFGNYTYRNVYQDVSNLSGKLENCPQ